VLRSALQQMDKVILPHQQKSLEKNTKSVSMQTSQDFSNA